MRRDSDGEDRWAQSFMGRLGMAPLSDTTRRVLSAATEADFETAVRP